MFKYIKNYIPVAAALLSLGMLTACSDDDNVEQDEWTATYVYIQRTDFLESDCKTFNLKHTPLELTGEKSMDFSAKVQKPSNCDISVDVIIEGSDKLPSTSYRLVDREGNALASNTLTIKAGRTSSDTVRMVLEDLSPLANIEEQDEQKGCIKIDKITTDGHNTFIASNPKMTQINFCINKAKKKYISVEDLPQGSVEIPSSSLTLTIDGNTQGSSDDLLDNSNGTFVEFDSDEDKGIMVDLGEEKKVTAIQTIYKSSYYACTNTTIMYADGEERKEIGTMETWGDTQTFNLLGKPKVRYLYIRLNEKASYWYSIKMTMLHIYTE